jgi:hypothetical protein
VRDLELFLVRFVLPPWILFIRRFVAREVEDADDIFGFDVDVDVDVIFVD